MANLKRRPEKDLNHDNWDDEDVPEEKGEFSRATEEEMKARKVLVARRKVNTNNAEAAAPSNPFSSFSFATGTNAPATATPSFNFGIPTATITATSSGSMASSTVGVTAGTGTLGGTGSLFKIAGITPSSEPPTRASADSSTADGPEYSPVAAASVPIIASSEVAVAEPEIGNASESEGITEESSNSSSLPWNVSSRQQKESEDNAADSMNNLHGSNDMNNASWIEGDDLDDKEASAASSSEPVNSSFSTGQQGIRPATSSALADSSDSSSASNQNNNRVAHFSFGNSFRGNPSGSLFQSFASASTPTVSQNQNSSTAEVAPSSAPTPSQSQLHSQSPGELARSPESSGIVRSSLEDDSADYENDTTSSSNKLPSENDLSNDCNEAEIVGADREAEADFEDTNEEREAEGVDS